MIRRLIPRRLFGRLRGDRRGTALMEFAFVLPVLLLMFLGGYELSDGLACKRRVVIMTRAIADMTSQSRALTTTQLDTILSASRQIMAPYSIDDASVRVTQLTLDASGLYVRVDWSQGKNTGGYAKGWYYASAIPAEFRRPGATYVWAQSAYHYDATLDKYFSATDFSQNMWMLPRRSSSITLT